MNPSYLAVLGRQPAISLAELISLYPHQIQPLTQFVALSKTKPDGPRLGGTIKYAEIVSVVDTVSLRDIISQLVDILSPILPDNKTALGLSLYGFKLPPKLIFASSLELKKSLKSTGKSIRIIPGSPMDAAQIHHNRLTDQGHDIILAAASGRCYIGLTRWAQDVNRYAQRDHGRPARSAKVGMLPPKLAQIMINLARPLPNSLILDPFCGTGVVLQEALLMGFSAYGSDINPTLTDMSRTNLSWLEDHFGPLSGNYHLATGDAATSRWKESIGAVITEGYLGPPLTSLPSSHQLDSLSQDAAALTIKFLSNLHPQLLPQTPVCLTLPAWRTKTGFHTLKIIDQITGLGYTLKQFLPVQPSDLLYARPDQIVGRQLVTLIRK